MARSPSPALGFILACAVILGSCASTAEGSSVTTGTPPSTTLQTTTTLPSTPGTTAPVAEVVPWIVYQSPAGLRLIAPDGTSSTTRAALPDGPNGFHPDWSPDGQMLAFVIDDPDGTRDIWTANWDGTNPTVLVDCQAPCRDAETPAWSPDGTKIAFVRLDLVDGRNPGSKIQTVDVGTGKVETIAETEGADNAGGPRWAPSGLALVVEITRFIDDGNDTSETTGRTIAVIDITETPATIRPLMPFDSYSSYPDWHPTQDLIMFLSGSPDPLDTSLPPQNLFTIKPDGSDLVQITKQGPADDGFAMPTFRRDGDGIFATLVHRPGGDLTLASLAIDGTGLTELGGSESIPGAHPRQRPPATGRGSTSASADEWIVVQAPAGQGDGIYLMRLDGSDTQLLYPEDAIHPDWAHDGRRLAFEVPTPEGIDIYLGTLDGSTPTLIVDHDECPDFCLEVTHPAWSPDDAIIAYVRNRYDIEEEQLIASTLESVDVATGATQVLYTAPADRFLSYPRWSPDGTRIVFAATFLDADPAVTQIAGSGIFVIDITEPEAEPAALTEPGMFATYPDWSATEDLIVFSTYDLGEFQSTDEASNLYTIRPDGTGLEAVTSFGRKDQRATQPTWTPDGRRIIFTLVGDSGPGAAHDGPRQAALIDPGGLELVVIDGFATHPRLRQ